MVQRFFVEKKPAYAVEAQTALENISISLTDITISALRIINCYDIEGMESQQLKSVADIVLSEAPVDNVFYELETLQSDEQYIAVEFLPGQFDMRASSAAECIHMLYPDSNPTVKYTKIYRIQGNLTPSDFERIKTFLINKVEARVCSLTPPKTLKQTYSVPESVMTLDGFCDIPDTELEGYLTTYGLAMDFADLKFCRDYFKKDNHTPTITELRMIDTYWSDHCRHTTFGTILDNISIDADYIKDTYAEYQNDKKALGRTDKPVTLMDLATLAAKKLKAEGKLQNIDISEEINACSIKIKVDVDGVPEDWLLMFKNETHNHPTEIEPFGGAATCLGGAIRDPLSGRCYVYQAMRVTGSGNPLLPSSKTIKGKLESRKITATAASGYSSYGNQIGLPTGIVDEIYSDGYAAKRLEIGAVLGAVPVKNVRRETPIDGDLIILLGGRTGRDGCGGATGSSKTLNTESVVTCSAEVQKGNAPEERKLQRLFRNAEAVTLIKRCNDFGAGGVSVAIGELSDGLLINLDKVTKKYEGLDGTEIAISESQERMAVVVAKEDADKFIAYANSENLEATVVAVVNDSNMLTMQWNGQTVCKISREFLNTNGAPKHADVTIKGNIPSYKSTYTNTPSEWLKMVTDLNICSKKGLADHFDSTIGGGTVLMPWGGKFQKTPIDAMVAKIPVKDAKTSTVSLMSWGFNPVISAASPYHGAMLAVVESVAKLIATGGSYKGAYLSFQEYFPRTNGDPVRFGLPFSALLGAYKAQKELDIAAIGGKDSMSGTFVDSDNIEINVPPTLVSFAVNSGKISDIISPEFKLPFNKVYAIKPLYDSNNLPNFSSVKATFDAVITGMKNGTIISANALGMCGIAESIFKMSLGNEIGIVLNDISDEALFEACYGGFVFESCKDLDLNGNFNCQCVGETIPQYEIVCGETKLSIAVLEKASDIQLEPVFKTLTNDERSVEKITTLNQPKYTTNIKIAKPHVLIPVFPGSNGEYDMARAFDNASGESEIFVIKNLTTAHIHESINAFAKSLRKSQIVAIPGGFSGGDEPEGSAKFIATFFRNPLITDCIRELLNQRDGLMLGICNGFQALIKLGLVPFGDITPLNQNSPTLTFNSIGHHKSNLVATRICSDKSVWFNDCDVNKIYTVPASHGEGRFVIAPDVMEKIAKNGQIATQYTTLDGTPTMDIRYNPNGSMYAVEGITSPDGRILGKMGHSERISDGCCINVDGFKEQPLFTSGINYFK